MFLLNLCSLFQWYFRVVLPCISVILCLGLPMGALVLWFGGFQ